VETPEKVTADTPENARVRILQRLKELHPIAHTSPGGGPSQKQGWIRPFRTEKNKELQAGSWVYLSREVHDTWTNPKLDQQVDGPYRMFETDGQNFVL
jgi:hypothetical protein